MVTGGGSGISEAIARAFADEGARVVVNDIDAARADRVASAVGGEAVVFDVSDEKGWAALETSHPALDIVVNNAGITGFESGPVAHDPENAQLSDWHHVHAVNMDGTFLGCRYAIRAMRAKGAGSIINMSSRSGMVGIPAAAAYASSKAAIRNHTKTVALYCAQEGLDIRCNSIHPAAILTPMWEPMLGEGEARETAMASFVADTPQQRFGQPEEVAALTVLLASDKARDMTGTELTIDGGLLAGSAASPQQAE